MVQHGAESGTGAVFQDFAETLTLWIIGVVGLHAGITVVDVLNKREDIPGSGPLRWVYREFHLVVYQRNKKTIIANIVGDKRTIPTKKVTLNTWKKSGRDFILLIGEDANINAQDENPNDRRPEYPKFASKRIFDIEKPYKSIALNTAQPEIAIPIQAPINKVNATINAPILASFKKK
ncbi:hypothetical protein [Gynuella sp.]|uniref:hypothetical protein n=1 Tax=Gynuella sp. TaxID=2969146 RepID=UPI003D13463D